MKVVIFDGYGPSYFPEYIQKLIKAKDFPQCRCGNVVSLLESYPNEENIGNLQERYDNLKIGEVLRWGNKFFFGADLYTIECSIEEVDISRKWTISVYDGAEDIKYLKPKCISEELNYWEEEGNDEQDDFGI